MNSNSGRFAELDPNVLSSPTVENTLGVLQQGFRFARNRHLPVRQFAITLEQLLESGCAPQAIHALIGRGFAVYAVPRGKATGRT
jgi:hypothetical protein